MELQVALVNKTNNRVDNIIIVANHDDAPMWETDTHAAIPVTENHVCYLHGLWDGADFIEPDNEYLVSIGVSQELASKE